MVKWSENSLGSITSVVKWSENSLGGITSVVKWSCQRQKLSTSVVKWSCQRQKLSTSVVKWSFFCFQITPRTLPAEAVRCFWRLTCSSSFLVSVMLLLTERKVTKKIHKHVQTPSDFIIFLHKTFNPRAKKSLPAAFPQEEALFVSVHSMQFRCVFSHQPSAFSHQTSYSSQSS